MVTSAMPSSHHLKSEKSENSMNFFLIHNYKLCDLINLLLLRRIAYPLTPEVIIVTRWATCESQRVSQL